MELELRPIVPDELPAYKLTDQYAFGFRHDDDVLDRPGAAAELDRTVAAFEGDEIVGIGRNYSMDLTLPGGAMVPASAVSWIGVRPTHRRRGLLRRIMSYLLEEGAQRGESVSILTASEGGIYARFGYGVASRMLSVEIPTRGLEFVPPVTRGRVRMVEPDACLKVAPELFDRVRAHRNGAVSRPTEWWSSEWVTKDMDKKRFDAIYEVDGRVDGFVVYTVEGSWINGINDKSVAVHDLVAATPEAETALWQYLCTIDLTQRVTHWNVPPDIELPFRVSDARAMRVTSFRDWTWVRPVDVPAFLSARTYATSDRLSFEIRDEMRPDGAAVGRFVLEGGPDGARCERTDAAPDLVLGVGGLGSISLGGVKLSLLARAGTVEEQTAGAIAVADRMFAADRSPFAFTWF